MGRSMQRSISQLREALRPLSGLPILEWRNGYGESGSLHLGTWAKELQGAATRQRGTWIITVWEAHVRVTHARLGSVLEHPPNALSELSLGQFAADRVKSAEVDASGLLTLQLLTDVKIEVIPALRAAGDADQWVMEAPNSGAFIVRSGPTVLQEQTFLSMGGEPVE